MEERNGLYCVKNATLLPPPKSTVKVIQTIESIDEMNADEESETSLTPPDIELSVEMPQVQVATVKPAIQVETATETEEENFNAKQDADDHIEENGAYMEPTTDKAKRPDPPASGPDNHKTATRVRETPPQPIPSPPADKAPIPSQPPDEALHADKSTPVQVKEPPIATTSVPSPAVTAKTPAKQVM